MRSQLFYKTALLGVVIFMLSGIPLTASQYDLPNKEGTLKIGSADIYYKIMGSGTPTFILHGGPGDTHDTMLQLSPLGNDFRLIFYDQRAAGRSTGDADTASHTIEQFVEDLEQLRLKLGADKINLIGGSWGSMVAMQYAMKYSDNIQAMVLMSSMGIRSEYFTSYQANIEKNRTPEDRLALVRIQKSEGFQSRDPDVVEKFWRTYFRAYCCNPTYADRLHLWMRNATEPEVPGRYAKLEEFLADYNLGDDLKNIKCPTLILHGDCDPTPVEWVAPIHEKIAGSKMQTIPNAGHWLWVEGADQVIPKIRYFFKENRSGAEHVPKGEPGPPAIAGTTVQGPYTVYVLSENIYRIEDANESNPAGMVVGDDGQVVRMNNCSDMYLVVGRDKALLIDLSNDIKWDAAAAESLRAVVYERTGERELLITVTHNHGDHLGMLPAFARERKAGFWIPEAEFRGRKIFPEDRTRYFPEKTSLDLGGGIVVHTLEVPGHTAHSTLFFLKGKHLVFSGDAIGSGSGVWLFDYDSFAVYRDGVNNLIAYIEDPANRIDPEKLEIQGGHAWQRGKLETLTGRYVYDMQTLIERIGLGIAESEAMSAPFSFLDTNFKYGTATITWNKAAAVKYTEAVPAE